MSTAPYFYEAFDDNPAQKDRTFLTGESLDSHSTAPVYHEMKSNTDNNVSSNHQTAQNKRPSLAERGVSQTRLQSNGQSRPIHNRPLPAEPKEETTFSVPRKPAGNPTVSELQKALDDAHEQINRFVEERASLHLNDQFRAGDDKIGRESDALRADIRQWSRKFTRSTKRSGFVDKFKDDQINPFLRVTNQYQSYLQLDNGKGTSLLVQGYVWMRLKAEVFHQFVWVGGPCEKKRNGISNEDCELAQSFEPLNGLLLGMSSISKEVFRG